MPLPLALYYPHTKIADQSIVKNALLLWDNVEYITPNVNWKHERAESNLFNEAIDIVSAPHFPTDQEKKEAHKRVEALLRDGLPPWFFLYSLRNVRDAKMYAIY